MSENARTIHRPLALIAELTHRCPLHCVYCSNPAELTARANELSTQIWFRVFREAAALGVMQLDRELQLAGVLEAAAASLRSGRGWEEITTSDILDEILRVYPAHVKKALGLALLSEKF